MTTKVLERLNDSITRDVTANIGKVVKRLREERDLTQDELAKLSGTSQATISKLEAGKINDIGTVTLTKIGCAFGLYITPWWLE